MYFLNLGVKGLTGIPVLTTQAVPYHYTNANNHLGIKSFQIDNGGNWPTAFFSTPVLVRSTFYPFTRKLKKCVLPTNLEKYVMSENWQYILPFISVNYEKPDSPCHMHGYIFWWGCRGSLTLNTLGSERGLTDKLGLLFEGRWKVKLYNFFFSWSSPNTTNKGSLSRSVFCAQKGNT